MRRNANIVNASTAAYEPAEKPRACVIVATPATLKAFLGPQLLAMADSYELFVVADFPASAPLTLPAGATPCAVKITRKPSPLSDIRALIRLTCMFRNLRLDLIQSVTPKAGLLAMTAGRLARVPVRWHTFTGQVWATRAGPTRWVLRGFDRVTARLATHVLVDSPSQRDFLIHESVLTPLKARVVGSGSVSGVDACRFKPDEDARRAIRAQWGISDDGVAFIFVGRLNREKGVLELTEAFRQISRLHPDARLIFVGPDEDRLADELVAMGDSRTLFLGPVTDPQRYLAAADVLCLPSHREGFGTVIIEAAGVGIPTIASRIYGVTDAVIDGRTGILHTVGNIGDIASAMMRFIENPDDRHAMGRAARRRAIEDFSTQDVVAGILEEYSKSLVETASRLHH